VEWRKAWQIKHIGFLCFAVNHIRRCAELSLLTWRMGYELDDWGIGIQFPVELGHKGPVLRSRCIGLGRARTQIPFIQSRQGLKYFLFFRASGLSLASCPVGTGVCVPGVKTAGPWRWLLETSSGAEVWEWAKLCLQSIVRIFDIMAMLTENFTYYAHTTH